MQLALNAYFELNDLERFIIDSKMIELQLLKRPVTPVNVDKRLLLSTEIDDKGEIITEDDARKQEEANLKALLQDPAILKSLGIGGSSSTAAKDAQASKKEVVEEKKVQEKTAFDVELTSFVPDSKVKIIKEIKDLLKLGLREVGSLLTQAKEMVESAPVVVKAGANKEEAEKLQAKLIELGCKVTLK